MLAVTSFKLTSGRSREIDPGADIVHKFTMSVVTYTYNKLLLAAPFSPLR